MLLSIYNKDRFNILPGKFSTNPQVTAAQLWREK